MTFLAANGHLDRIRRELVGRLTVSPPSIPWLGPDSGELTVPGLHKGWAVRLVLDTLGIPAEASIAIGDRFNDIEILRAVGTGVAMADAPPDVRAAASHVTDGVEHDGVARAFAHLGLTT